MEVIGLLDRERSILAPTNDSPNSVNNTLLEKLPIEHTRYESVNPVVEIEDIVHYPIEFLHTFDSSGVPPQS